MSPEFDIYRNGQADISVDKIPLFNGAVDFVKNISINDAEKIISDFNKQSKGLPANHEREKEIQDNRKSKDIKSTTIIKKKTKKVSKK